MSDRDCAEWRETDEWVVPDCLRPHAIPTASTETPPESPYGLEHAVRDHREGWAPETRTHALPDPVRYQCPPIHAPNHPLNRDGGDHA